MNQRGRLKAVLIVAGVLAFALKIYLALSTNGISDTAHLVDFAHVAREQGGLALYYKPYTRWTFFNHPPFMVHVVQLCAWLATITPLPLSFWVRLPSIVADIGTLCLLWKLTQSSQSLYARLSPWRLILVALAPVSILVFGFHGNTDAVMICFVMLSIYCLHTDKAPWIIGLAFGMSLNIKVVPLLFVPAFLLTLREPRRQFEYSLAAATAWIVGGIPYLLQDPQFILSRVFGYSGQYGNWGFSRLLNLMQTELPNLNFVFEHVGKFGLLFAVVALTLWMNWSRNTNRKPSHGVPIEWQCALIVTIFISLTPAFGYQYLAWLVPFLPLWNWRASALFTFCGMIYLLSVYTFRWRTWSWYANTPWLINNWKEHIVILETLTWCSVLVLFYLALKQVAQQRTLSVSDGSSFQE